LARGIACHVIVPESGMLVPLQYDKSQGRIGNSQVSLDLIDVFCPNKVGRMSGRMYDAVVTCMTPLRVMCSPPNESYDLPHNQLITHVVHTMQLRY